MTTPKRIQRKRTKGWRKPEGAVIVDRSTVWGNPFHVGVDGNAEECVALYRRWLNGEISKEDTDWRYSLKARGMDGKVIWMGKQLVWAGRLDDLRGKDLVCWCAPDSPCHASVLLELANKDATQ